MRTAAKSQMAQRLGGHAALLCWCRLAPRGRRAPRSARRRTSARRHSARTGTAQAGRRCHLNALAGGTPRQAPGARRGHRHRHRRRCAPPRQFPAQLKRFACSAQALRLAQYSCSSWLQNAQIASDRAAVSRKSPTRSPTHAVTAKLGG